ncbi:MAG: hypothetical protein J0L62_05445 [Bacteroidetes bacterium]|nr:hypothetical protein [Bacteroidota bacterium]
MEPLIKAASPEAEILFPLLADLLDYPTESMMETIEKVSLALPEEIRTHSELYADWQTFVKLATKIRMEGMQEIYTSTFDLNPVCPLFISIGLFGEENFNRSLFMARMIDAFNIYGFCLHPGELPDSIPTLLQFAPYIIEEERYKSFIDDCLIKPSTDMLPKLEEKNNPYAAIFKLILHLTKTEIHQEIHHA